jgi:glycosyltransferase involved in cell wall biosynthesis
MKIVFLSFYSGEVYRGVETHVHYLANELIKQGNDVTVFQNGPVLKNSAYVTQSVRLPVNWSVERGGKPFLNYWSQLIKMFTQVSIGKISEDTDIVIPTNGEWQYFLVKMWCLKHHKKMVIAGHSGVGRDERIALWSFPDYFVAFTKYQMEQSQSRNPFLKYIKIPNGVDVDQFKDAKPMKINLPKPIIMTSSALVPIKRIHLIVEAVAKLNKVSLLIVGTGIEEERLKTLCEEKLPGRYKITHLPPEKIPAVYKASDLFTFATSPWESFGIVLIEAMASGLGVVTTNDPIRREIVGEAGIFIDPTDTDTYAKALNNALNRKWGDVPLKQAERYSWSEIAKQYNELFVNLVK